MPPSLAPTVVYIVSDLEDMGALLRDLLSGAYVPTQPDENPVLREFLDQLRDRSGIDFTSHKAPTIARRLPRRIVHHAVQAGSTGW